MSEAQSYINPPIVEAIFEILTEFPHTIELNEIEKLHLKLSDGYSKPKPRHHFEGKFEIRDGDVLTSETINLGIDGHLFWANDNNQVVQFRKDGFSFSRLKPYSGWDTHFSDVMKLWGLFADQLKPSTITRTALRFINQIEIPEPECDLKKYLRCPPQAPSTENINFIENFISKIQIAFPNSNIKVNITQMYGAKNKPNVTPIILDLDTYSEERYEPVANQIIAMFNILRSMKNMVFQQSITEETESLFQ